ncbi:uncharacterized protein LOC111378888 [Olea europaea var. sylvestris]|uniref:Uncharacterized protein n=1 Tax=Olea europaea subsp. europaea TaxID=158383 RepID=A0A8S0SM27_OLEEU|nr:uncharacterized protein LOC111378888 [Olea europaea var. sylvestris]CAA2993986.1 Hypothetical predicted protein [Olea europaea subsp. europaea]
MGRKKANGKGLNATSGSQRQISMMLREESTGKKRGNLSAETMLKLDYMKDIAIWASVEAKIPPLGALYGRQLAASYEALGIPPDPSLFFCESCESILEPGQNCTVRIETNKAKTRRRRKKMKISTKNNVVYTCNFCSHRNIVRGTPEGYMKETCQSKAEQLSDSNLAKSEVASTNIDANEVKNTVGLPVATAVEGPDTVIEASSTNIEVNEVKNTVILPIARAVEGPNTIVEVASTNIEANEVKNTVGSPVSTVVECTGTVSPGTPLLESMRRKRSRSSIKKVSQTESSEVNANAENVVSASKKRKRKSWTSLKDIVENNKNNDTYQKLTNLTIPF